jgi:hypothetical protein
MHEGWIAFWVVVVIIIIIAIIIAIIACCANGGGCCWDGKRYGGGWAYGGRQICRVCNQSNCNGGCGGRPGIFSGGGSGWTDGGSGWGSAPVANKRRSRISGAGPQVAPQVCGGCNRFVNNCICASR